MREIIKKIGLFLLFAILLFSFSGCATGDSVVSSYFYEARPVRLAIVDISGHVAGGAPKNQVADFYAMELLRKGYQVVERERVERLLAEQDFQRSDVTSGEEAARMGEILNVDAVAMLDVDLSGEKLSLTGRIVDTETGNVLWIGTGRAGSGQTLATIGGAVAGGAAGSQVGAGRGRTAATVGGAILGGVAGHTLAPQTARVVQRAIRNMARGLPQR